ncbi:MAG: hypothetical protein AVDCRST_MAG96-4260 [uncultured Segetibacter sp.]|uniref:Uncharacterized protein n=1 Tax=uncultured Segetibacter sp. TaxID=481133 RepID=A0A6J4U4U5_9BACT|nr:MAG: hypothetical protein AVDCRST_MAG96-4260 [uncultured Segetibacter sp.]
MWFILNFTNHSKSKAHLTIARKNAGARALRDPKPMRQITQYSRYCFEEAKDGNIRPKRKAGTKEGRGD